MTIRSWRFRPAVVMSMLVGLWAIPGSAMAQTPLGPFIGLDIFAGGVPGAKPPEPGDANPADDFLEMGGWQIGGNLRVFPKARWLGVTLGYAQHSNPDVALRDVYAGIRATSPWLIGEDMGVRGFAHALGGFAQGGPKLQPRTGNPELIVGGGVDLLLLRIEVDYVKTSLPGIPGSFIRGFVGGVVPLCFSGCRDDWEDGIDLSGGR